MCGIVGAITERISPEQFDAAVSDLMHRGPDNQSGARYGDVWLGHTRLAINDLSQAANQPFEDPISGCVVVFNGEIYNYRTLRSELEDCGGFKTDSEVEVLARLYGRYGEKMVQHLDGMFAFAIVDSAGGRFFAARDPLGKKPFFYSWSESKRELYFASELKAFRHFPLALSLDTRILDNVLNFTHYHQESLLQGIQALPPGGYLSVDLGTKSFKCGRYHDLAEMIQSEEYDYWRKAGIEAASSELEARLRLAVKKRLMSDVPVAVIASGGLDSSLVSVYANSHAAYPLLHIDSVDSSEIAYAKQLSSLLGIQLLSEELDYRRFADLIHDTIERWEYPLVHTNATGIMLVAQLARRHGYEVLLGGEGADELFGGYPQHILYNRALLCERFLSFVPKRLLQALIYARSNTKGAGWESSLQHIENAINYKRFYERYSFITSDRERRMQAFLATELEEYLIPLLSRADRMTMALGVETRLPYLDLDVVRYALNLPIAYKMRGREQKVVLRRLAKARLPMSLLKRPKVGFTVDYARAFVEREGIEELDRLNRFVDSRRIISHLKDGGQYHKILRLYSLDYLCRKYL